MIKKKILILTLCVASIGCAAGLALFNSKAVADEVKVLDYRAAEGSNEKGYEIGKVEGIGAIAWINENEVLTVNSKPDGLVNVEYLSKYNLNTKETTEFKDAEMDRFYGVSKTGKFVLYEKFRNIDHGSGSEDDKAYDAGTIQRVPVKLLNLETGEITSLKTDNINADADYRWISDDKILVICNNDSNAWKIINIKGDVCAEGVFDFSGCDSSGAFILGADDLKDLGDSVEGKFYYSKWNRKADGCLEDIIYSLDVSSKKEELVGDAKGDNGDKKGNSIVAGYYNNNGEAVDGVFVNRTFGFKVFDDKGKELQSKESASGIYCSKHQLSPDGSKVSYVESANDLKGGTKDTSVNVHESTALNVMDVKTGEVKEVAKLIDFKDSKLGEDTMMAMGDLSWDATGTSLMVSIEYSVMEKQTIKLDEEGKKMFNTTEDTKEISVRKVLKNDSYIINFDK